MKDSQEKLFKELMTDIEKVSNQYAQRERALDKFTEELEAFNGAIKIKIQDLATLLEGKEYKDNKMLYDENLPFMQVSLPYLQEVARYYEVRITYRDAVNKMNQEIIAMVREFADEDMEEFVADCRKIMREWFDELDFLAAQVNDQMNVVFEDQKVVADAYNSLLP